MLTPPGSRRLRLLGVGSVALVIAAGLAAPAVAADPVAPLIPADPATDIPGSYIVVLKNRADTGDAAQRARDHGGRVKREYGRALRGYNATLDAAALAEVRRDPEVAYVEQDHKVFPAASTPWGLDRIDQDALPLNGTYNSTRTGVGVTAYVIDSGIRASHVEFGGRVATGKNFFGDAPADTDDCYGHGTHVAGIIGGATYGVAKAVALVPVRVFGCKASEGGDASAVVAAVNWVSANRKGPAVVNMSLYGDGSTALDLAVQNSINQGITYAVAAGNEGKDACDYSPARLSAAITVGASTADDELWGSSNTGACLDLYAPGVSIPSAYNSSDTATKNWTGTSMATPHVAGAAALYLQANPNAGNAQVRDAIVGQATAGALSKAGDLAGKLLFVPNPAAPLWLARTAKPSGNGIELNAMTAASGWTRTDTWTTKFPPADAPNGNWQVVDGDLWFIKFRNTGYVEVHSATGASGFRSSGKDYGTALGTGDGGAYVLHMVGTGLWTVRVRSTSSTVDVFGWSLASADARTYTRTFAMPSNFPLSEADNGTWQVANSKGDLWFIRTRNTGAGTVEVRQDVVSGKSYKAGTAVRSWLSAKEADNGKFLMNGEDLWFVKLRNTDSGKIELYSATKASGYQAGSRLVTSWSTDDADAGAWSLS
jgi:hypothetical protein